MFFLRLDTHCTQGAFHSNIDGLVYLFCLTVEASVEQDITRHHIFNLIILALCANTTLALLSANLCLLSICLVNELL